MVPQPPGGGHRPSSHLSLNGLGRLAEVCRPAVDPRDLRARLVHVGLGAFHRAHQAVYTEAASAATGSDAGIVAVAPRDASVVARARAQDHLFSVTTRSPEGASPKVVGSLVGALHLADDAAELNRLIASPEVTTVTLTVTEKGYHRVPGGGPLDLADPRIASDLEAAGQAVSAAGARGTRPGRAAGVVRTVPGALAVALAGRFRSSGAPIDVVSCDNLDGNGPALATVVRDFVTAANWPDSARIVEWLGRDVGFPSTVVDRIVPATTPDDLDQAQAALGTRDDLAVSGEPYSQWVLEDAFRAVRPAWEHGGAQFVADVVPFQLTKLRLLNGSHSGLAYLGLAAGCRTIGDVLATGWGETFVRGFGAEVAASLPPGGPDPAQYVEALVARFANTAVRHELRQIGADGSLKLPQRWVQVLRDSSSRPGDHQILALAAWASATRPDASSGGLLFGTPDPAADALMNCWTGSPGGVVARLLRVLGAPDLADDEALTSATEALLPDLARGVIPS
ncbi:mannitol dehydrogenase family protein [Kineosporia mesophila]|uniref:mannitol dehydrogenase family protein n=1 Tax=Kineosporia mesophila TaxID=566012 RepID=UPI001E61A78D|nr:mannitol dehydrogenase family protein [Kineosporia mesophila]